MEWWVSEQSREGKLSEARMPALMRTRYHRHGFATAMGLGFASLGFLSSHSLAQQPPTGNPAVSSASPPTGQFVGSFIDPTTGKQYDRYWELVNVPMPRLEQREVTERRAVPHWVTENVKTTEVRYVPTVEYQVRQRVLNQWNPMAQPQVAVDYVPVTRYQAVYEVVDRPMQYQKYVEQDVKVLVPKLVEATEARMKLVDRERTSASAPGAPQAATPPNTIQNAAEIAMANRNNQLPRYTTRPIDGWYSGSQAPSATYPYSPYPYLASAANSPYYGFGNMTPNGYPTMPGGGTPMLPVSPYQVPTAQMASNQTVVSPVGYMNQNAYPSTYVTPYSYAASQPAFQWPSWTGANGPLFHQDFFPQSQTTPYAYGGPSTGAYNYPMVATQSDVNGTLRPSTSPMLPPGQPATWGNPGDTQTYRDPVQAGLPPTVLR
jgi:hypothetical protein